MPRPFFSLLQVAVTGVAIIISFSSLRVQKAAIKELQATVQTPDIAFESETDIGLWARFHFAIHTGDFNSTRGKLYRRLGFTQGITGFLPTNTHACACPRDVRSLSIRAGKSARCCYFLGPNTTGIDLLQWRVPFNPEPSRRQTQSSRDDAVTLMTGDLMSDYALLKSSGRGICQRALRCSGQPFCFHARPRRDLPIKLEERRITAARPNSPADPNHGHALYRHQCE